MLVEDFSIVKDIKDKEADTVMYIEYIKSISSFNPEDIFNLTGKADDGIPMISAKLDRTYVLQNDLKENTDEELFNKLLEAAENNTVTCFDLLEGVNLAQIKIYDSTSRFIGNVIAANTANKDKLIKVINELTKDGLNALKIVLTDMLPENTYLVGHNSVDMLSSPAIYVKGNKGNNLKIINPCLLSKIVVL